MGVDGELSCAGLPLFLLFFTGNYQRATGLHGRNPRVLMTRRPKNSGRRPAGLLQMDKGPNLEFTQQTDRRVAIIV
jgi:hypothetical protein